MEVRMNPQVLLRIDAGINFVLGVLLVAFPVPVARWMGLPIPETGFYVNILGAVFIGITLALLWEARQGSNHVNQTGLGVVGAAVINLCGGLMLAGWLVWGELSLAIPGLAFLWLLVAALVGISVLELSRLGR
jgi:hypothetical protein